MDDQMNESRPIDFSRLGPPLPAERFEALVADAVRAGNADLERRRGAIAVVRVDIAWRRPLLAISGLAAAAAIALIVRTPAASSISTTTDSVAEALGIPSAYAERVEGRSASGAEKQ